jgi:CheY-like chemotaxis protein
MPDNSEIFSGYRIKADVDKLKLVFSALLTNKETSIDDDISDNTAAKILLHIDRVEADDVEGSLQSRSFYTRVSPSMTKSLLRITIEYPEHRLFFHPHASSFERKGHKDGDESGFRMFIAKNILALHGIDTDLFQDSNCSSTCTTTYHLDFPLYAAGDGPIYSEPSRQEDIVLAPFQSDPSDVQRYHTHQERARFDVLIVDDSAMVRRVTAKLVTSLGHTIVEACDGQKAVDLVASGVHFDVILMDNQMPVMTGVQATKIIRNVLGYRGMILGVTGNALEEDVVEFLAAVVLKPLTKEIFESMMTNQDDLVYEI